MLDWVSTGCIYIRWFFQESGEWYFATTSWWWVYIIWESGDESSGQCRDSVSQRKDPAQSPPCKRRWQHAGHTTSQRNLRHPDLMFQNMLYSKSHSIKWYTSSLFHFFFPEACKWDSALLQTNEDNIVARRTSLVTLDNTGILYTHTESRRQKQNNCIQITLLNDTDIHRKSNSKS